MGLFDMDSGWEDRGWISQWINCVEIPFTQLLSEPVTFFQDGCLKLYMFEKNDGNNDKCKKDYNEWER